MARQPTTTRGLSKPKQENARQPTIQSPHDSTTTTLDFSQPQQDAVALKSDPAKVIFLQRTVGNRAVRQLLTPTVQRAPAGTPGARPVARRGHSGEHVGVLQQKLNSAQAATPPLVIDAQFGPLTQAAVIEYQRSRGLAQDGVAGPITWGSLDTDAPGGGRNPAGEEEKVPGANEANPVAIPDAGTSIHPTVQVGSTGPAVEELQEKLNGAGAAPPLTIDGTFADTTRVALTAFQTQQGIIPATGIADGPTWARLDQVAPGSTVGRVERQWSETVGGQQFGMTSRYTWRINATEIRVTVNIKFTGLAPKPSWFGLVRGAWNRFKAVETTTAEELNVEFDPQQVAGGEDRSVNVAVGPGRANAAQWFLTDPDEANTIPHEFGHLVGLQDEYQLTAGDYERTTGNVAPVGELTSADGATASTVAREINAAITGPDPTQYGALAHGVVRTHGIRQGAFAQQVATSYQQQFGQEIVRHMSGQIPDASPGSPGFDEFEAVDPFTYSSGSTMGDPSRHPDAHDHGVQPRHVREFVEAIRANRGGTWEVRPR